MAHRITALIGNRRALSKLMQQFGPPVHKELSFGLIVMPLGELRLDLLKENSGPVWDGFTHLSQDLEKGIIEGVGSASALYIETNYSGGTGRQGAASFKEEKVVWKQTMSSDAGSKFYGKTPISLGLAELGVVSDGNFDEFDMVGLYRYRSLESLGIYEWPQEDGM